MSTSIFDTRQHYERIDSEKASDRPPVTLSMASSDEEDLAPPSPPSPRSLRRNSLSFPLALRNRLGPTLTKVFIALSAFLVVFSIVSLMFVKKTDEKSIEKDVERYFEPLGIQPARWDVPAEGKDIDCVRKFSGGGEVNKKSSFLADLGERISESGCKVYPVPDKGLITHLFWSGKWRTSSHGLTLDAWLATQPFETSSLIWWYQGEGPPESFVEKYTGPSSPYRNVVSFRRFDESLAKGTCLMTMPEWSDPAYQKEVNLPIETRSDLIRLLLLSKYGGIWLDADSIPLRDFTPLVRVGAVVPSYDGTINNNFLLYGPAWGGVGERVLELACQMPYSETKIAEMYPELKLGDRFYWIYNMGVHKLCRTRGCGVGDIGMQLVDGMYWSKQYFRPCDDSKYKDGEAFPQGLHGPFTWHARMTQRKDNDTCYNRSRGTLLSAVQQRIEGILEHNKLTLSQGRDLFPGPGYIG